MSNSNPVEINITARDGWQSNHGMNITADDFIESYANAGNYGVASVQTEGGTTEDLNTKKGRDPAQYMKAVGAHFEKAGVEQTSLIRGEVGSSYTRQPYDVLKAIIKRQAETGVNVLQNFHAMNDINMMRGVTKATDELVEEHGYDLRVQGGITIQQNPDTLERKAEILEGYKQFASELVEAGHDGFYLKSANGVITDPDFMADVVTMLKEEFPEQKIALHMHNTYGHVPKIALAAIKAGVDSVDVLPDPLAEGTAQMGISSLMHAIDHSGDEEIIARRPNINLDEIAKDEEAQYRVRASMSKYEMPFKPDRLKLAEEAGSAGGAISALKGISSIRRGVAHAIGVDADDWGSIQAAIYKQKTANREALGYPTNVTPHELMQDLQAAHDVVAVAGGGKAFDFIAPSTAAYLTGALGRVSATVDKDLQGRALEQEGLSEVIKLVPIEEMEPGLPKAKQALIDTGVENPTDDQILNAAISGQGGVDLAAGRIEPQPQSQLLRIQQEGGALHEVAPLMFKVAYSAVELTKVKSGFYDGVNGQDERIKSLETEMAETMSAIEERLNEHGHNSSTARKARSYMITFATKMGADNADVPRLDHTQFPSGPVTTNPALSRRKGFDATVIETQPDANETIADKWQQGQPKSPDGAEEHEMIDLDAANEGNGALDDKADAGVLVIAGDVDVSDDVDPFEELGDNPSVN